VDPNDPNSPHMRFRQISSGRSFGVLFATILLAVIVITNVPLRGMWSFMVILVVVALSIIFALAGWWDAILRYFTYLDIRINAGCYIFISSILFAIWLFTVLVFDKQIYMVFTPGQFKVCTEVGGGEQTYSTIGMTLEKQRSDLFRHWILGLGSGDLIVKTTGAQAHHFEMPNVLFIGRKMQQVEDMVRKIPD
jgi:FlaA1/EpsC-like NDP-sugar epimerase